MKSKIDIEIEAQDTRSDERSAALNWVLNNMDSISEGAPEISGEIATKDEINQYITALREDRKTIPHHSLFGDDNWEQIDTHIEALEWVLED